MTMPSDNPLDHVAQLMEWLAAADLDGLDLTGPAGQLRLRRGHSGGGIDAADDVEGAYEPVTSPGVGVFLHAHPLHAEPFVRPGDAVNAGQVVGLVRIGALLVPVTAPADGDVAVFLVPDGSLAGFGDHLVALLPAN